MRRTGIENAITFEFSHFMSPQSACLQSAHLYNRYMEYVQDQKLKTMDFTRLASQDKEELLERVVPFGLTHSQDKEFGGYFTCLDREGKVFGNDKFNWLQARQVRLFFMLYNKVETPRVARLCRGEMEPFSGKNPLAVQLLSDKSKMVHKWISAGTCDHLFRAFPSPGAAQVTVEVTDRFGASFRETINLNK